MIYNKLVRDNIPNVIESNNQICNIRILDDNEYKDSLFKKLNEECMEVINSKNKDELIEELGDLYEVVSYICKINNICFNDVIETSNIKRDKKGGFDKKIFLIDVEDKNNKEL